MNFVQLPCMSRNNVVRPRSLESGQPARHTFRLPFFSTSRALLSTHCGTTKQGDGLMVRRILASPAFVLCFLPLVMGQATGDRINFYFSDWHNATLHTTHGTLEERDIYTRGDPHNPTTKGAVLRFLDGYSYATLAPRASTKAMRLDGAQEIYFVVSGH